MRTRVFFGKEGLFPPILTLAKDSIFPVCLLLYFIHILSSLPFFQVNKVFSPKMNSRAKQAAEVATIKEKVAEDRVVLGLRKVKKALSANLLSKIIVPTDFGNAADAVVRRGIALR